jgi:hypothetical protein
MLKPLRKILFTTLGILPMIVPLDSACAAEASEGGTDYLSSASELPWRKARLSLEAQTGTRTIGTLDALIPFAGNDDFIVYADLMAKGATDNAFEGNLGLGFRRVNDAETAIFGMYAFYDVLKSVNNNQFSQVTVGAERLGLTWDFRANAYLPVGKTKYEKTITAGGRTEIVEHNIIEYVQTQEEAATYGGDVEMGRTLGTNKVRGYVALYTFGENLTGPRARVEYQVNSHVALNAAVQYDQTRKAQYFVGARFTVGGAKTSNSDSIYARLTDPIVRDFDIVTKNNLIDTTKIAKDKFWMVDQSTAKTGGTGTIDNPYSTIEEAVNNASEGAIIYVKGVDGKVYQAGHSTQLKKGQMLVGSAHDLYFDFTSDQAYFAPNDKTLFLMRGNGITPTMSGTLLANANVGIYNFNLIADELVRAEAGIKLDNAQHVIINDVTVSGFNAENGRGLWVTGDSQVSLSSFTAKNNYLGMDVASGSVNVTDVLNIDQSQLAGLRISGGQVTTASANVTNSGTYGVEVTGGQLTVQADLAVSGGIESALAVSGGGIINADSVRLSNGDLYVDAGQLQVAHELNVGAAKIDLLNGGVVNAGTANVNADSMTVNQGIWSNSNGLININGTDGLGLLEHSNVTFGSATISTIDLESASTLTLTDTLNTASNVTINNATLNTATANLTQGDLIINGGVFNVSKQLTLNAEATQQIAITNAGNLSADAVNINTGNIIVNNATWSNNSGVVTVANNVSIQNKANANFASTAVSAQNIIINGADSKLVSTESVTANSIAINAGTLNGKDVLVNENVAVAAGKLNVTNILTMGSAEKVAQQIAVMAAGSITAGTTNLAISDLRIDGLDSFISINGGTITTKAITVSNSAKLLGAKNGSLIVDGAAAAPDSFELNTHGEIAMANVTVNNSSINVDAAILNANILTTTHAAEATDLYQISITNGGSITATDQATNVATNKVILDKGTFAIAKGSLAVTNSDVAGVALTEGSQLAVNSLTVNSSAKHGIAVNNGEITANTITSTLNANDGINISQGSITVSGAVKTSTNGQAGLTPSIGNGLVMSGDPTTTKVHFKSFDGSANQGTGVIQSGGTLIVDTATLTGNKQSGFIQLGGTATILTKLDISGNTGTDDAALDINGASSQFTAFGVSITGNTGLGLFLEQGTANLTDVTINTNNSSANQLKVTGAGSQTLIIKSSDSAHRNTISAGTVAEVSFDPKDKGAILIDSANAVVNISNTDISNNVGGFGTWVAAGTVTMDDVTSKNNQQAIIFTQGDLTIKDSIISDNTEYAIVARDDGAPPLTADKRILKLNNVSLMNTAKGTSVNKGAGYGLAVLGATQVTFDNAGLKSKEFQVAKNAAGGIYSVNSDLTLMNVVIANNVGNGIDLSGTTDSNQDIKLTLINSQIGNIPGNITQLKGINANVAGAFTALLDNTQITANQGDGMNITATNAITMTVQNQSKIDENKGSGLIVTNNGTGNTTLNISNTEIKHNTNDGLSVLAPTPSAATPVININLDTVAITNNTHSGIYIQQSANSIATVNATNLQLLQNQDSGIYVTHGSLEGQIQGDKTNIQPNNKIKYLVDISADWKKYE